MGDVSSTTTMMQYDDFDAWGNAISGASLRLACNGVVARSWSVGVVDLGGVVLQMAHEGGGTICYGASVHPGTTLFVPLTHADRHVVNGRPLDDEALLAIPRGADFQIYVRKRAHAWCSIALPFEAVGLEAGTSARITGRGAAVPRLRRLVQGIAGALLDRPGGTAAHLAAGRELATAAVACLTGATEILPTTGRPRLDRGAIIRRAMAVLEAAASVPAAAMLARDVGVTSRTLLRTFREAFGVTPKEYLMLHELHAVRRGLSADEAGGMTVADVLTRHGIWEFGRFANRYRKQFGELPSETLRRTRG
jgi:AraC family ethanolamine operon transcriptional activator